jgi:hypothetical protein
LTNKDETVVPIHCQLSNSRPTLDLANICMVYSICMSNNLKKNNVSYQYFCIISGLSIFFKCTDTSLFAGFKKKLKLEHFRVYLIQHSQEVPKTILGG